MKKQSFIAVVAVLACGAALAQAPKGTLDTPSAKTYPNAAGGASGATAQDKAGGTSTAPRSPTAGVAGTTPPAQINPMASGGPAQATAGMGANARIMDVNGDGMISQKEWNRYHSDMWGSMKAMRKNGSVPMTEVDARMRGTPK